MGPQVVQPKKGPTAFLAVLVLLLFIYVARSGNQEPVSDAARTHIHKSAEKSLGFVPVSRRVNSPSESDVIAKALERSETLYQKYVGKRRSYRAFHKEQNNSWTLLGGELPIWDQFIPAFGCPYSVERIGSLGSGGKWICGFELYEKPEDKPRRKRNRPCIVYSFGLGGDTRFEAEFLNRTKCEVYSFDGTVYSRSRMPAMKPHGRLRFIPVQLSNETDSMRALTLDIVMKKHRHSWIDVLKLDLEGSEFKVLRQIVDEFEDLPFGQLIMEFHVDDAGKMLAEFYQLWERLEEKGLRAFRNELNFDPVLMLKQNPTQILYSFVNVRNMRSKFYVRQRSSHLLE